MLKNKRQIEIYEMLLQKGSVKNRDLCQKFGVSDMTIRRDMDQLTNMQGVIRTHGGALYSAGLTDRKFGTEQLMMTQAKEQIAVKALSFLQGSQSLFIDSGTTTVYVAKKLPMDSKNIVLSNNLRIVQEVSERPDVSVMIIGGSLRKGGLSCYGSQTEEQIRSYHMDIAFLGASAVGIDGSLYDGYLPEVGVKKSIITSSQKVYVLVDSTKFDKRSLAIYGNVRDVTGIITDPGIDDRTYAQLTKAGANIIIAE